MRPRARARTVLSMPSPVPSIVKLARVPGRVPRADLAIAAGMLVWALLEALFLDGPGSTPVRVFLAVGFTAPLALRRRWPIQVLLAIALLAAARGALEGPPEEGAMPFPALLLASFSAALYARPRWLAYAAAPVPIGALALAGYGPDLEYPPGIFISLTAWLAGFLIRRRAEQLARARAEGPELAREAVAAERARMARELHDVVAHSVTVISVQAGAAEGLVELEPAKARTHLEAVRRAAHEALVELRRLVGVLREDTAHYTPQPGLARLPELLQDARDAGLQVELEERGNRDTLPAGLDLTAYRIVQESLTNVRKHAGAVPTRVLLSYGPDALEVSVVNAAGAGGNGADGDGHGLIGMQERVRLYEGTLETGDDPDGGFRVHAKLPLEVQGQ
jgi:signal transduction histidine kinase